jgi:uracil-DNA glycosylase
MRTAKSRQTGLDFGLETEAQMGAVLGSLKAWAPQQWPVAEDWQALVRHFLASAGGLKLAQFIRKRLASGTVIYPVKPFWALELTPLSQVRVVILGQDPYHGAGQAQGLAFSVPQQVKTPPSLRNMLKEIQGDPLVGALGVSVNEEGLLVAWAHQGVLLLNTVLTVEDGQPASHVGQGWEALTDEIVRAVAKKKEPVVFMLWGKHAQSKLALIESVQHSQTSADSKHLILTANHPSPLSATRKSNPFIGCGHFSKANEFLSKHSVESIDWQVG